MPTIPDPTEIPGWDPAWNLTVADGFDWYLDLSAATADGSVSASWDVEIVTATRATTRPYLSARRAAAARGR